MGSSFNFRDLFIRVFVILITSLVLALSTKNNQFDLHFKIRKTQPTSNKIQVIEVSNLKRINKIVDQLIKQDVAQIFVDQVLYNKEKEGVTTYTTTDRDLDSFSIIVTPDLDGITRRFQLFSNPNDLIEPYRYSKSLTINFRGPSGTFEIIDYYDISEADLNLNGKFIILASGEALTRYTTPVGLLDEVELFANILDNYVENRFIPDGEYWIQILVMFFNLFIVTAMLLYFPSTLALISTSFLTIFYISISLWIFDNFYFWTPILNPVIQNVLTFLLISNFKFVLNEKTKWNLEKESQYFNEVEEMKTNFLSLFSHDLKTPLAKIIGITDTLISKTDDSETLEELDKINLASRDLEKYIKRILKMSQVQSKNVSLNKSTEDINILIEKSIQQVKGLAVAKNIKLNKNLKPLFMLDIDGSLVQEVIVNFIENAIKYSPEGSEINIFSEEYNNYVKVTVKDQGPGIPKEVQDSIWEKYYRFDNEKSGYGLGLFLSRYVINLHGGQVFLKSRENEGSEFSFIIPIGEDV